MAVGLFVLSIALLIVMITKFRIHAFISLITVALLLGLVSGIRPVEVAAIVSGGFGGIMSYIGIVIICGIIIGEVLEVTGGTQKIADSILQVVGVKRAPMATTLTGAVVSIPVFCDSGFVILNPIIKAISKFGKIPYMTLVIALMGGLLVTHSFVPPTPGPIAAAGILGADLGKVMIYGIIVTIPVVIGLVLWANSGFIRRRFPDIATTSEAEERQAQEFKEVVQRAPSTFKSYMPIVVPIILIVVASVSRQFIDQQGVAADVINFIGTPFVALLLGTAIAFTLPEKVNGTVTETWVSNAMKKGSEILLITAAAGAFGKMLQAVEVGDVLAEMLTSAGLPMIVVPFMIASLVLIAQGSATVALTTTAAIVAPILDSIGLSPEMAVLSIAAGSFTGVQANGSYFWCVSKLAGFDLRQSYIAVTLSTFVMGAVAFVSVLVLSMFIR
ncbi:GntP family permease [Aliagarivorans taiwanensis]|uniref:GntP family permease n=1 Tax=Aliagarivorans taiwanensis TaxID=561966 RepID=UPI0004091C6A|nr:SLC13 family permease [Aliagarivorans taiwanensis]